MSGPSWGVHSLVWTGAWSPQAAQDAARRTAQAGFDVFELGCLDNWEVDVEATRRAMEEHGLRVVGSLGLGAETDVTSPDPEHRAAGEALIRRAISIVRDLGGTLLTGIMYAKLGKYDTPPTAEGWARSVEVMQRMADVAAQAGVTLGVEVVNRYDSNLVNTAADAVRYLEDVDRPNLEVHLDTYHMNLEETDFASPVHMLGERLGYIHVSESHRGYLGSGTIDFLGFFKALAAVGYSGTVTFESFSSKVVDPNLSNVLGIWRDVWDDSDHLAAHARSTMAGWWEAVSR